MMGVHALRVAHVLVEDLLLVEGIGVVQTGERLVLQTQHETQLLLEVRALLQIPNAKADAAHLVLVCRTNAAPGGAEAVVASHLLAELVEHRVVGHHHVRPLADHQVVGADAISVMAVELCQEGAGIDDDPVTDHAERARIQDAAGHEVEPVLLPTRHHCVSGVVPALGTHHHVHAVGEQVDDLALALVAPLSADEDSDAHGPREH
jgi:hypothetical protein